MAKVKIQGHASGTGILTVTAPNTSTDRTITLPDATATIATTADVTAATFNPDAAQVFNESSADVDFRVESNTNANALFVDGRGGAVGIAVVPSYWNETYRTALQVAHSGSLSGHLSTNIVDLSNNAFYDGGDTRWEYINSSEEASQIELGSNGAIDFKVAPSGTADAAVTWTTAMTIDNSGYVLIGTTVNNLLGHGASNSINTDSNGHAVALTVNNNSYSEAGGGALPIGCLRSNSSAYAFAGFYSGNGTTAFADKEFEFRGDGQAYCEGSWNGGGADYAEYFEWKDGNASDEDRRGISVVLDGDKIRPAVEGETPIGVISGNPSAVGDSASNKWAGKYTRDDFGTYIFEEYTLTEWEAQEVNNDGDTITVKKSFETDRIPASETAPADATVISVDDNGKTFMRRTLNPDWNPDTTYVSREDRKEWDTVGLMGKLRIRKGQPTGSNWIKMRDVSDAVEEWLIK